MSKEYEKWKSSVQEKIYFAYGISADKLDLPEEHDWDPKESAQDYLDFFEIKNPTLQKIDQDSYQSGWASPWLTDDDV